MVILVKYCVIVYEFRLHDQQPSHSYKFIAYQFSIYLYLLIFRINKSMMIVVLESLV